MEERRRKLIGFALERAVTARHLVRHSADGYAYSKRYEWAKGDLKVEVELSHSDGGTDHVDLQVRELGFLVFHVSGVLRMTQRNRSHVDHTVHRDIAGYWEATIRHLKQ